MKHFSKMLTFLTMFIVGVGCCSIGTLGTPDTVTEMNVINNVQNSTVALVAKGTDERHAYCAGVWVSEKRIITANHCVVANGRMIAGKSPEEPYDPMGDVIVFVNYSDLTSDGEIPDSRLSMGIVDKVDKEKDLAMIQAIGDISNHDIAKISSEILNKGNRLHIIGHTAGLQWSYTTGVVSNVREMTNPEDKKLKVLQISAPIWMGNSGGGAFNEQGELVGICSWINSKVPNVAFFIHKDEVVSFLSK